MDQATLVEPKIAAGRHLIARLDESFPITAAYWLLLPEVPEWRLFLASPIVDRLGARGAYERLQVVLSRVAPELPLFEITLVSASDPIAIELSKLVPRELTKPGIRLAQMAVNGTSYAAGYLYRPPERYRGFTLEFEVEEDISMRAVICWVNVDRGLDDVFRVSLMAPTRLVRMRPSLAGKDIREIAAQHAYDWAKQIIDSESFERALLFTAQLEWDEQSGRLTLVARSDD